MLARIRRTLKHTRDRGASAVEYGLLVAAIAAVIVGVVFTLGGLVKQAFSQTCSAIVSEGSLGPTNCDGTPVQPPAGG